MRSTVGSFFCALLTLLDITLDGKAHVTEVGYIKNATWHLQIVAPQNAVPISKTLVAVSHWKRPAGLTGPGLLTYPNVPKVPKNRLFYSEIQAPKGKTSPRGFSHRSKRENLTSRFLTQVDFKRSCRTKRKFHPTPVTLSLLLGFPWLLGAGMGGRGWHTAVGA